MKDKLSPFFKGAMGEYLEGGDIDRVFEGHGIKFEGTQEQKTFYGFCYVCALTWLHTKPNGIGYLSQMYKDEKWGLEYPLFSMIYASSVDRKATELAFAEDPREPDIPYKYTLGSEMRAFRSRIREHVKYLTTKHFEEMWENRGNPDYIPFWGRPEHKPFWEMQETSYE